MKRLTSKLIAYALQWDALSYADRIALLFRAMPDQRWTGLRERMANTMSINMTTVQQEALGEILNPRRSK